MKRSLILNAIDQRIGGVLIRGERGTAKSTAARARAALLPEIEVFADSPFNDDPAASMTWSDWVKDCKAQGMDLKVVQRRIRFIDLPVSATEDRVVGTLDIEKAIKRGEKHFEPGVLAAANRGLLYIDEVNLLDDHVVDLLLDPSAMGVNVVEREGISFAHPARFILVGTMNPEEGELRIISALSCHYEPLHPDPKIAAEADEDFRKSVRLAKLLGVPVVNVLSGCPAGAPGDQMPNWVTCTPGRHTS